MVELIPSSVGVEGMAALTEKEGNNVRRAAQGCRLRSLSKNECFKEGGKVELSIKISREVAFFVTLV